VTRCYCTLNRRTTAVLLQVSPVPTESLLVEILLRRLEAQRLCEILPEDLQRQEQYTIKSCDLAIDFLMASLDKAQRFYIASKIEPSIDACASQSPRDLKCLRASIAKMDDSVLLRFGIVSHYLYAAESTLGEPPTPAYALQLREARHEWKRRKHGTVIEDSF
jgi:hypothetical protein